MKKVVQSQLQFKVRYAETDAKALRIIAIT